MTPPGGLHAEVLPPEQLSVLGRIGAAVHARGFYMAGGTALALQLGHRRSVDFDWFREEPVHDPLGLASDLALDVLATSADTLHATLQGVKLSFFTYRYPLLEPLVAAADFGCWLASLADVAAMKLAAITQRGARKDYHDVVAIGQAGLGLEQMLAGYRRKFSVADVTHVLVALTWFDDADKDPEPVVDARQGWPQVKATLREWVRELARA